MVSARSPSLEFEHEKLEKISYTKEEVDGMYLQYNNPLEPSESFIGEFNKMLTSILLYETMAQGYFGGDKFEIYEPEGI